jgi:hypothetical protein
MDGLAPLSQRCRGCPSLVRATPSRYLKAVAVPEVLREGKIGREKLFVNISFLTLLVDEEVSG